MVNKVEIDVIIGILNSVISLVESIDPESAKNPVVVQIQNAIKVIQGLGL
jgi:hypothetical protein